MALSAIPSDIPLVVLDDGLGSFGPLTDLRPAHGLRAGVATLRQRLEACFGRRAAALLGAGALEGLLREEGLPGPALPPAGSYLVVNGRVRGLRALLDAGLTAGESLVDAQGRLVAAWLRADQIRDGQLDARSTARTVAVPLASAPWELTASVGETLEEDIAILRESLLAGLAQRHLRPDEGQSFGSHPILIDPSATVGPLCVIDASKGPVVVGPGVVVRPLAVLVGPCVVLDGSTVAERSLLKSGAVIGPHCRAGGEIGSSIFQGYSNKSHDGHLGDSFVGEWVNIGAGSDNSNLLNTYGEVIVRLEADGGLVRTGRQFWGSIIGDHVKLAIGTRLMTGTTIGTGAMIARSTPPATLVPRFAWSVDAHDAPRVFRFEKFLETARAMMSRRGREPGPALVERLRQLHAGATGA